MSKSATGSAGNTISSDSQGHDGASSLAGVESLYYVGDSLTSQELETKSNLQEVVYDECSFPSRTEDQSGNAESGKMAHRGSMDCNVQVSANISYAGPDISKSASSVSTDETDSLSTEDSLVRHGHDERRTQTLFPRSGQCCVICVFGVCIACILVLVGTIIGLFVMVESIKGELRNTLHSSLSLSSNDLMEGFELSFSSVNSSINQLWDDLEQKAGQYDVNFNNLNSSFNFLHREALNLVKVGSKILANVTGQFPSTPAVSCASILQTTPTIPSGDYWIRSLNGTPVQVYCNMSKSCGGITGGWMRVAQLDTRIDSSQCPSELCLKTGTLRTCRICEPTETQSRVEYPVPIGYSKVCGKVIAYQYGSTDGLWTLFLGNSNPDGVVLSYGQPRRHIWTFVAGRTEAVQHQPACPCLHSNSIGPNSSSFFGNDYFCDTGDSTFESTPRVFSEDPLWDGRGCEVANTCCTFNNPPWFFRDLGGATTDSIDMGVFRDQNRSDEDVEVEQVELYVL